MNKHSATRISKNINLTNSPSPGAEVSFSGITMAKIENAKITEKWIYYNQLPIYNQIGYKLVLKNSEK